MKLKSKYSLATCILLATVAGCSRSDQAQNSDDSATTPSVTREVQQAYKDVTEATKEAATATKNYVAANKDEFVASMDKKLKELDARIDDLSDKTASFKDAAKTQMDLALTSLREQRAAVGAKFEEVKKAGAETWNDTKAGFDTAMSELEKAYENVKAKLSQPSTGQ
jgi:CHASE3 domain sensor protein